MDLVHYLLILYGLSGLDATHAAKTRYLGSDVTGEIRVGDFDNIVVLPDVHGDSQALIRAIWMTYSEVETSVKIGYDEFKQILLDGISDDPPNSAYVLSQSSSGPNAFVQLGNVIDFGPDGLTCLLILDSLPELIGWKVFRLYGNHELMAHRGRNTPFVHPKEDAVYDAFFGTVNARVTYWGHDKPVWKSVTKSSLMMLRVGRARRRDGSDAPSLGSRADGSTPRGSFRPESVVGSEGGVTDDMMRRTDSSNDVTSVLGVLDVPPAADSSVLFVHAGIELQWIFRLKNLFNVKPAESDVAFVNRVTREILTRRPDSDALDLLDERQSPVNFRDLADLDPQYVCSNLLPSILAHFDVARLIVGHSTQDDFRMKSFCGSRLVFANSGMSRWSRLPVGGGRNDFLDDSDKPVFGNPSGLVLQQSSANSLQSMRAMYYDEVHKGVQSHGFFTLRDGPVDHTGMNRQASHPDVVSIVRGTTGASMKNFRVKLVMDGFGMNLHGHEQYRIVDKLMARGLDDFMPTAFGLPRIVYASKLCPHCAGEGFDVFVDAQGVDLVKQTEGATLMHVRQIMQLVAHLAALNVVPALPRKHEPQDVLNLFIVESRSNLVKLVDFSKLTETTDDDKSEDILRFVYALARAIPSTAEEPIDYPDLVREYIGDLKVKVTGGSAHFDKHKRHSKLFDLHEDDDESYGEIDSDDEYSHL